MTSRILWAALAAAVCTQVMAAHADQPETRSVTVRFGDLNLAKKSGVDTLRWRIRYAAEIVCGDYRTPDLQRLSRYRSCVDEATQSALARVERPAN
jgi:UrcA family protein